MCESNRRIQVRRNCVTVQCDLGTRAEQSATETLASPITDLDNRWGSIHNGVEGSWAGVRKSRRCA